jgi:hypothetical protein
MHMRMVGGQLASLFKSVFQTFAYPLHFLCHHASQKKVSMIERTQSKGKSHIHIPHEEKTSPSPVDRSTVRRDYLGTNSWQQHWLFENELLRSLFLDPLTKSNQNSLEGAQ